MRMFVAVLVFVGLVLAGCGGGGRKKKKTPTGPSVIWTPGASGAATQPVDLPLPASHITLSHTVYDSDNDKLVCYSVGAWDTEPGTWIYDFTTKTWTKVNTSNSPGVRFYFTMAYMPTVGVILYGGLDASGNFLTDTWIFNGTDWSKVNTTNHPTSSAYGAMCYDGNGNRIIYFGGIDSNNSFYDETWAFNGSDWTNLNLTTAPSARGFTAMAYDSTNGVIVLYGGFDGNYLSDTWEFDVTSNTWTQVTLSGTAPPPLDRHAMAFNGSQIVLIGGWGSGGAYNGDIYTYNAGTDTWTQTPGPIPVGSPPDKPNLQRVNAAVFNTNNGFFIFGGYDNYGIFLCDLWKWDGTNFEDWTLPDNYPYPAPRCFGGMAYLQAAGKVILFGGEGPYGRMFDVWEYDPANDTWNKLNPGGTGPVVGRSQTAMCEVGTDKVASFGGLDGNTVASSVLVLSYSGGSYSWDSSVTFSTPPQAPAAAYDPNKQLVGIFGGYYGGSLATTHTFDGSNLQENITVNTSPAGRLWHAMAYHPTLQKLIMFGGANISASQVQNAFNDTYALTLINSSEGTWELLQNTLNTPAARLWHSMCQNDVKHVIIMYGGYDFNNDKVLDDAWVLDEQGRWLECSGQGPGKRMGHMMARTGGAVPIILFGGISGSSLLGSWWLCNW